MKLHDAIDLAAQRLDAARISNAQISPASDHGYRITIPDKIANWRLMLGCRKSVLDILAGLPNKTCNITESHNYEVERLLETQSYLTVHWALCDSVTSWVGRALCYGMKANAERDSLKLPELEKCIPERLAISVRNQFGYAIALSYQIRNCFIHDGGIGFFYGPDQRSGLKIAEDQWNHLHQECQAVKGNLARRRSVLTLAETERDLGVVLQCCETEIDEALGVLLLSASALIDGHLGFLAALATP